jgi:hypothetical protein
MHASMVHALRHRIEHAAISKIAHEVDRQEAHPLCKVERLADSSIKLLSELHEAVMQKRSVRFDSRGRERTIPDTTAPPVVHGVDLRPQATGGIVRDGQ